MQQRLNTKEPQTFVPIQAAIADEVAKGCNGDTDWTRAINATVLRSRDILLGRPKGAMPEAAPRSMPAMS